MQVFRSVLSSVISLQIVLSSMVFSHPALAENTRVLQDESGIVADAQEKRDQNQMEEVAKFIEEADFDKAPTKKVDTFHITSQKVTITDKKTGKQWVFNPATVDISRPEINPADFDREVKTSIDSNGALLFSYENKRYIATHEMTTILPVSLARDKDMLIFISQNAALGGMDMGYTRAMIFKSPLFAVSNLKDTKLYREELETVKIAFISPGINPMKRSTDPRHIFALPRPKSDAQDQLWDGDIALYTESKNERTQIGEYDYDVVRTQLMTAFGGLALLAFQVSPPDNAAEVVDPVMKLVDRLDATAERANELSEMPLSEREAMMSLSVETLLARAKAYGEKHERGTRTREEWFELAPQLLARAKAVDGKTTEEKELREAADRGELGPHWQTMAKLQQQTSAKQWGDMRPLWQRMLTSKAMRNLAMISAGTAAIAGIAAHTAWGVQIYNKAYENFWPEVLKDVVYRETLLKSSLALIAFIPLAYIIGMVAATRNQWAPRKALAFQSIRLYARMALPFWHRITGLIQQPNLLRSMARGFGPMHKVEADSAVGRRLGLQEDVRPALGAVAGSREEKDRINSERAKIITEMSRQKARVRTLAWSLALQTAARQMGLDPVTLATLTTEEGAPFSGDLEKALKDPKFQKLWARTASELEREFEKIAKNQYMEEMSLIPINELNDYVKIAMEKGREIATRNLRGAAVAALKRRWYEGKRAFNRGFATFGKSEYDFMMNSTPNDFVVSSFWKQFVTDYFLAVVQVAVIGDRANLDKPHDLAADVNGSVWTGWTNRAHGFDMVDQVAAYNLLAPAQQMMTYQDWSRIRETAYDPIEQISMVGHEKADGFFSGFKTWFAEALDPVRVDEYGIRGIRFIEGKIRTVQFSFIVTYLLGRVIVAGQDAGRAFAAFIFWQAWNKWGYGYPWDLINLGNKRYEEKIEARRNELVGARSKIAVGLRTNDMEKIKEGMTALEAMSSEDEFVYGQNHAKYSAALSRLKDSLAKGDKGVVRQALDEIETISKDSSKALTEQEMFAEFKKAVDQLSTGTLQSLQSDAMPYTNAIQKLRQALNQGDPAGIGRARAQLEKIYVSNGLAESAEARAQLTATSLLEHSLLNPPFATQPSKGVVWTSTGIGAFITTYLGTAMAVFTFDPTVNWTLQLVETISLSATLYASYLYGTRWAAQYFRSKKEKKEAREQAARTANHESNGSAVRCQAFPLKAAGQ